MEDEDARGGTAAARVQATAVHLETFRRWGLTMLGEIAALPSIDLSERMGQEGLVLQQLARGVDRTPLVPDPGVPRFVQSMELEWPIDALEPLSFVFARLLDPLSAALERADRGAAALRLDLRLVEDVVDQPQQHLAARWTGSQSGWNTHDSSSPPHGPPRRRRSSHLLAVAACSPPADTNDAGSSGSGADKAKTATSAADLGGMDALVAAAKKEGALNVIALPPDWANYGAIISAFGTKYGIKVTSAQPDASSADEISAANRLKGQGSAPDVFDLGAVLRLFPLHADLRR